MSPVDRLLNRTTGYRLLLVYLIALLAVGLLLAIVRMVPVSPFALLSTLAVTLATCLPANRLLARLLRVEPNRESSLITALILTLISAPVSIARLPLDVGYQAMAGLAAVCSKYVIVVRRRHLFNPAAFGIVVVELAFGQYPTWWVGTIALLPIVALGGLLVLRKIHRLRMAALFLAGQTLLLFLQALLRGAPAAVALTTLGFALLRSELPFAAIVMLTEPATSPVPFPKQAVYALATAVLFLPDLSIGPLSVSPEVALLVGNLIAFLLGTGPRLLLRLHERREIAPGILLFSFARPEGLRFRPGQYLEWTLATTARDDRGNRRIFTIASSPTESELLVAARCPARPSAFKRELSALEPGGRITASGLGGDFVLPRDAAVPLAFVAGGIGITPFRSMIKYLVDRGEARSIVLLFLCGVGESGVFEEVLREGEERVGLRVARVIVDRRPGRWAGLALEGLIPREIPDYADRRFYLSGPLDMVEAARRALHRIEVPRRRITTDLFPGYR